MTYEVTECSPQAKQLINPARVPLHDDTNKSTRHNTKYPFGEMLVGQCFTIPLADANEHSLRQCSYRAGVRVGKKFAVIKHKDYGVYEVARIA